MPTAMATPGRNLAHANRSHADHDRLSNPKMAFATKSIDPCHTAKQTRPWSPIAARIIQCPSVISDHGSRRRRSSGPDV